VAAASDAESPSRSQIVRASEENMRPIGWSLATLTALALALAGCGDARPTQTTGGGGGGGVCTVCHGDARRTGNLPGTGADLAAAPPVGTHGETLPTQPAVGAHQAHLNPPATGSLTGPLACANCHDVPSDTAHATNPPAQIVHFNLLATTGGAAPTWTATNTTCSNVYCHGNFTFGSVTGTTTNAPDWTQGSTQATCGSCHGLPPTGHVALSGTITAATCNGCHPGTVDSTGKIIVDPATGLSLHVNGQSDVVTGCTSCHGTAGRTGTIGGTDPNLAAAPPLAPAGEPAAVVGAHQAHLNPAATGSLAGPFACSECHLVPTDSVHASNPPAQIVQFGTLATTGGAAPTWNSTDKTTNTTCSSVYCHGNFTFGSVTGTTTNAPDWTQGSTQATCGSCHGLPPTGHVALPGTVTAATCNGCHPGTVASDGTIVVNVTTGASLHVNGQVNEGAHSDPNWYVDPAINPSFIPVGGDHTTAALDYTAPGTGVQGCLQCHVNFGSPTGTASSSCNSCHASALAGAVTTDWRQNCVFCHGDKTKLLSYATADQTSDPWIIAPPVGTKGETFTTDPAVGAHQKHVSPTTNALSSAFLCSECHTASLPPDISQTDHLSADGSVPVLLAGALATNGGVTPSWTATGATCSATYCHGNFSNGGNNATPAWTGDSSNSACTSCHGITTDPNGYIEPLTGRHPTNWSAHAFMGNQCQYCHNGIATASSATATPTIVPGGRSLHVNGARDVSLLGSGTWTPNATGYGGTCAPACHGSASW
jgi:predicted CxxxxCH...CXXCH cytochrome family protein